MSNQRQLVRRTAAVLLVCGVITSLLPGFAAAQDLSTVEKRASWLIEQRRDYSLRPNGKNGAAAALARLALNPDDAYVIDRITHYFDDVPAGSNGNQFNYPGVAWVLGRYWDKFTPVQRDHLKEKLKGFDDLLGHGTENHAMMKCVAAYLFAQYWPDETGWVRGTKTSAEVMATARGRLLSVISSLYDKSQEENLSTNYGAVHLFPCYALYDCAKDPNIKAIANAAIHFHVANMAANNFEGVIIPPTGRHVSQSNTYPGISLQMICWLYWGEVTNLLPRLDDYALYAALSNWRPPAAINSLASGETVPYELKASMCDFNYWGEGTPGMCLRYVYRDKLYTMGSGFLNYSGQIPDNSGQTPDIHTSYHTLNGFGLIYKSPDKYNYIDCYQPYWQSNTRAWIGLNSPFMQMAQYKGTAIHIFNIPIADPWAGLGRSDFQAKRDDHFDNLIQEALLRYPKSIDQKTEAGGWIFLREGDVYIAIRPLKAYRIDTNYAPAGADFNVVRSAFAQTGFVFDIATKKEFATFEAFQTAAVQNPPVVDWDQLSVKYKNARGDTLTATWNTPKYDAPKGERVLVRPDIKVNGAVVPIDSDFIKGKAVMKSPSVELIDRVLRLKTPAGRLEVDWRGKVPKFSNQ